MVAGKPRTSGVRKTSAKTGDKLPTERLDAWVRDHMQWNHQDWENLLNELRHEGHSALADCDEGREKIAKHIEEARQRFADDERGQAVKPVRTELDKWLKTHRTWNHDEWLGLLDHLRHAGHAELVNRPEVQAAIGGYLEASHDRVHDNVVKLKP